MGNVCSQLSEETKINREIDYKMQMHNHEDTNIVKYLLLGGHESLVNIVFLRIKQLFLNDTKTEIMNEPQIKDL